MKGLVFLLCITVVCSANLPRSKKVQLLGSCSADSQCDSGLVCNYGKCRAQVGGVCGGDSDCIRSLSCFSGKCTVKQLGSCSADSQCASGLVCYKSQCRAIAGGPCPGMGGGQYLNDSYCAEGLTCDYFGKCLIKPGGLCNKKADCAVEVCDDHRYSSDMFEPNRGLNKTCRGRSGDVCDDNSGCQLTNICSNKKCLELGWSYDCKCQESQVCSEYSCVAPPSCNNSGDCAYGLYCSNGKCLIGNYRKCMADSQCASGICSNGKCSGSICSTGECSGTKRRRCSDGQRCE